MKRLRILTGRHVGAHLDLPDGVHGVGAANDCDIALTDWSFPPLELTVSADGVTARWFEASASGQGSEVARHQGLADLSPREFDGIVLCVGPVDTPWPSDVQLLSEVFAPTPKRVAHWARSRLPGRLVPLLAAASLVGGVAFAWPWLNPAPVTVAMPTLAEARDLAQRELDRVTGGHLQAVAERGALHLTGLAEDAQEAASGRAAVEALRVPYDLVPRFAVATAIAEALRATSGLTHPTVRHDGQGVFTVSADVIDERAARAALDRVAADLAPAVARVDAEFVRIHPADPLGPILSRSQQEGLSVVQTRDGVKHIVIESARAPAERAPPPTPSPNAAAALRAADLTTTAHVTFTPGAAP